MAQGGSIKTVPGFTEVALKAMPARRPPVVVKQPADMSVLRPATSNPVWHRAYDVLLLIRRKKLAQKDIANMLGISASTLSSYLNQLTRPDPDTAKRIETAVELMITAQKVEARRGVGKG